MKELLAVAGATLKVTPAPGSTGTGGAATITTPPSTKSRAEGHGIFRGSIQLKISGVVNSATGATTPSPLQTFTLTPSAEKCRVDGLAPLRKGDKVTVTASPIIPGTPPTPSPTQMVVEVDDPGQTTVRGA